MLATDRKMVLSAKYGLNHESGKGFLLLDSSLILVLKSKSVLLRSATVDTIKY